MNDIDKLREALAADHTPLPWIGAGPSYGSPLPITLDSIVGDTDEDGVSDDCAPTVCRDTSDEDNALIVAAVNAAPDLLAELDAARAEVTRLRAAAPIALAVPAQPLAEAGVWQAVGRVLDDSMVKLSDVLPLARAIERAHNISAAPAAPNGEG